MAAEYVYKFCDLLTHVVNLEVPVYGVSFGRTMNVAADGTLSINLDREDYSNADVLGSTVPGKTEVYFERNGMLIWGGIIWSRTYQSQAKVFSFTMQTFESFFYKQVIEDTLTFTNEDQRNILCKLFLSAQKKPSTDIGVQIDPHYPFPKSVVRTTNFYNYDLWTYGKAFEYMAEFDAGLDFTIEVFYDEDGNPTKQLRVDNVLGATVENTGLVFDYPGNVNNYYWPENASRAATTIIGSGAGDGKDKLIVKVASAAQLADGYPDLQELYSNSDVSVRATLTTQAGNELKRLHLPITVPTLDVDPEGQFPFGTWNIGDYAIFAIEDPRFPDTFQTTVRIVGYTASPPSSDGPEQVSLVLEGQE